MVCKKKATVVIFGLLFKNHEVDHTSQKYFFGGFRLIRNVEQNFIFIPPFFSTKFFRLRSKILISRFK